MSVCGNRPETPGFFTACSPCACGLEVQAEIARVGAQAAAMAALDEARVRLRLRTELGLFGPSGAIA